jgi:integrase
VAAVLKDYEGQYGINHRKNSLVLVKNRSKHVARLLGSVLLPDLTSSALVEYMEQRRAEEASNRTINMELSVLSRAIGYTWKALWPKLKKLEENHDVGRALEPEEEQRVLTAAAANPSPLIYPFLMTLTWTGMRSDEARTLRWSQVDFEAPQIRVGKSKTEAGARRAIPMSGALRAALEHHAAFYARKLGPIRPDWHVFPLSNRLALKDPLKPVTSLKTAWETVRTNASVQCRLHDMRHSFCTKLGEAGVPESTMLDMMGHVSTSMLRRYSHIRAKARREAMDALEGHFLFGVAKESAKVADSEEKANVAKYLVS